MSSEEPAEALTPEDPATTEVAAEDVVDKQPSPLPTASNDDALLPSNESLSAQDALSPLTPLENTSSTPAVQDAEAEQKHEDGDSSSSLSAPPSPLTTHRPTSSKTSVDELPLTPLDADKVMPVIKEGIKEEESKQATPKVDGVNEKDATPTAVEKPAEGTKLPDNQVAAILEINAELIRIYNEFHAQNQTQALASEFQQYFVRLQANMQWLTQRSEQIASQMHQTQRMTLPILSGPPPLPFLSTDRIKSLYSQLPALFEKEHSREQKKRLFRQMLVQGSAPPPPQRMSSPMTVNMNGKRERPDDMASDHHGSENGGMSPRKRVDTGETKLVSESGSPAHMHGSPVRMNASPATVAGIARPSSSQSNSSNHASSMPPPPAPISFPTQGQGQPQGIGMDGSNMSPQDRMRLMQHSRLRALSGGSGTSGGSSPLSMNATTMGMNGTPLTINGTPMTTSVSSTLAQQNQSLAQTMFSQPPFNGSSGGNHIPGNPNSVNMGMSMTPSSGGGSNMSSNMSSPNMSQTSVNALIAGANNRPPPQIYPQLLAMVQNPTAHNSVQILSSKIPVFRTLPLDQQVGLLWSFQTNQMRAQQHQHQQNQAMANQNQAQLMGGQPGMAQQNYNPALGMRPPSAGPGAANMPPPPPPNHHPGQQGQMGQPGQMGQQGQAPNPQAMLAQQHALQQQQQQQQQQQRQLNLLKQQQAALGQGRPGMGMNNMQMGNVNMANMGAMGMSGMNGMPMGVNMGAMGMNMPNNMAAMGMQNMSMGGHSRMPSNPSMGPPPVPMSAPSPQAQFAQLQQGGYPGNGYPMSQQSQQQGMQPQQGMQSPHQIQQQMMTPAQIMQQQAAKMANASNPGGPGNMDPNVSVS